jgi:hypothetical protein
MQLIVHSINIDPVDHDILLLSVVCANPSLYSGVVTGGVTNQPTCDYAYVRVRVPTGNYMNAAISSVIGCLKY